MSNFLTDFIARNIISPMINPNAVSSKTKTAADFLRRLGSILYSVKRQKPRREICRGEIVLVFVGMCSI